MTKREKIERKFAQLQKEGEAILRPGINEWFDRMRKAVYRGLNAFQKAQADDIVLNLAAWDELSSETKTAIKPLVVDIMAKGGEQAIIAAGFNVSFDVLNARAIRVAEQIAAKMVREVSDETQKAIRHLVTEGLKAGKSMPVLGREIRPLVGLTEKQVMSVANYEERLLVSRPELSANRVKSMVTTYEKRLHRKRAEMIARTETANAVSEGSLLGYEQVGLDEVEFSHSPNPCLICQPLEGKVYKLSEAHGVIAVHPNCTHCWIPVEQKKPRE